MVLLCFAALLPTLSQVLQRRLLRPGRPRQPFYTARVVNTAIRLVVEDGLPYRAAEWALWRGHRVFVPFATIQNWVEAGGERAAPTDRWRASRLGPIPTSRAISPSTNCMTGPSASCRSSDNVTFKRLASRVLDHDPTHVNITAFFRRFRAADGPWADRQGDHHRQLGMYPEPIAAVFGEIPHQLCTFHVIREVTKAVLSAVARSGSGWPPRRRSCRGAARHQGGAMSGPTKEAIKRKVGELFVTTATSSSTALEPLPAGSPWADHPRPAAAPPLARADRQVYRLFDRRCRMATALAKLAALRTTGCGGPVGCGEDHLKKLMSPGLEKAWCSWTSG